MKDRLNAALSGSIAQNLDTQVSYLFDSEWPYRATRIFF
jgi:hypothetical protein